MEVLLVGRARDEDLEDGRDTAAVSAAEAIVYFLLWIQGEEERSVKREEGER